MAKIIIAPTITKHLKVDDEMLQGNTVAEVMSQLFIKYPLLKSYILDDTGAVRRHVTLFLNYEHIQDREKLSDKISDTDSIYVMQLLSGG